MRKNIEYVAKIPSTSSKKNKISLATLKINPIVKLIFLFSAFKNNEKND